MRYLIDQQQEDGSWGSAGGYALVPTLSATDALLHLLRSRDALAWPRAVLVHAVDRGLRALIRRSQEPPPRLPDTVGIEVLIPYLVTELNQQLAALVAQPVDGLPTWQDVAPLAMPAGTDPRLLQRFRAVLAAGSTPPLKTWHILEAAAGSLRPTTKVHPVDGAVCCSPAATAAWIGSRPSSGDGGACGRYLNEVARRSGGPVPSVTPITAFEQAWVLTALLSAGLSPQVPPELITTLRRAAASPGTGGGPGLPPDCDTTSATLFALTLLGSDCPPDVLSTFETDTHFHCWPGERTPSPTANAHVLEALGAYLRRHPHSRHRFGPLQAKAATWLCDVQNEDGSWDDKWHASPYYATACTALALQAYGGKRHSPAAAKAGRWIQDTQRPDGGWGIWGSTAEETAYALRVLLSAHCLDFRDALLRGHAALIRLTATKNHAQLWHDKDLYAPLAIIDATVLAALTQLNTRLSPEQTTAPIAAQEKQTPSKNRRADK